MALKKLLQALIASVLVWCGGAGAQPQGDWPSRPIKFIAPFAPGGPLDQAARVLSQKLSGALGQSVFVENVAGAGSTLGVGRVAQSAPDGYTIGLGHVGSLSIAPHMFSKLAYDPLRSLAPITVVAEYVNVLVVNADEPYKTLPELLRAAKEAPGKLTYGSSGVGSSNHLSGELLASMAGVQMTHVPYKGTAPAMLDLLGGRLNFMFDVLLNSMPHIQSGKLRALAVTNLSGLKKLPDAPPVAQTLPGYEVLGWVAVIAPAGTPRPIVDRLNAELAKIMRMPDVVEAFAGIGFDAKTSTPEELTALIAKDLQLWGPIIKSAGIKTN